MEQPCVEASTDSIRSCSERFGISALYVRNRSSLGNEPLGRYLSIRADTMWLLYLLNHRVVLVNSRALAHDVETSRVESSTHNDGGTEHLLTIVVSRGRRYGPYYRPFHRLQSPADFARAKK